MTIFSEKKGLFLVRLFLTARKTQNSKLEKNHSLPRSYICVRFKADGAPYDQEWFSVSFEFCERAKNWTPSFLLAHKTQNWVRTDSRNHSQLFIGQEKSASESQRICSDNSIRWIRCKISFVFWAFWVVSCGWSKTLIKTPKPFLSFEFF